MPKSTSAGSDERTAPAPRRGGRRGTARTASDITTFPNAVRFLMDRTDVERLRIVKYSDDAFKLDRMRALLKQLGDPQEQIRTIHIAGTNGKGSTAAMIAAMLRECDYTVGEYTSPHLTDVRERVRIDGSDISRSDFTEAMKVVAAAAAKLEDEPTFFEVLTALAFKHFAEQAVDIAIVETGLGGRLDSTNVITPEVSVITRIDLDHTRLLGRTVEEIAREKAGIFKPGVPALVFDQPEVEPIFREVAESVGAELRVVNKDVEFSDRFCSTADLGPHVRVCLYTDTSRLEHLPVPLPGEHQAINCGLALGAVDVLKSRGFSCPEEKMTAGLTKTVAPGRMQLVWERPRILVDGAHNPAAIQALMRCVGAYVPYDSMVCVFGCCQDKDIPAMLERVNLGADKIIFTRAKTNPRAADPRDLQKAFGEISGKMSQVADTLPEALQMAGRAVSREDLICVTGSFYLVGESLKHLRKLENERANA